ncbi:hypothetical protein [Frankia sp. R82]|uniref:hypothetical protein n=1 Tax=Frankia sp. R82 TaxID=2950553 RepID=UPI0020446F19|nr:hypothetical protein [Frankia sp. R82]MCM3884146.1 hypothetical protein [Frankia sp. R82]
MSTDIPTTFAGLPIEGEVSYYQEPRDRPQKTAEEFKAALDRLFATAGVKAVVWTQYTPYFNDGEPCVFGMNLEGVVLDPAPDGVTSYNTVPVGDGELPVFDVYDLDREAGLAALVGLLRELGGDLVSYEDVSLNAFGDPARVVARPDRFEVHDYSHD